MNRFTIIGLLAAINFSVVALGGTTVPATEDGKFPTAAAPASIGNAFALDLFGQLREREENLFFSPYSIDVALMMVRAGAVGATADEMTQTLKLPAANAADRNAEISSPSACLQSNSVDRGYELHSAANALWGQEGAHFLPAYVQKVQSLYAANLATVDFHYSTAAAKTINQWVADQTNDRIKNLVDPTALSDRTKLILTNAIYFKGDWLFPFKAGSTHDMPWNDGRAATAGGLPAHVAMMSQLGAFDYLKQPTFAALQMAYKGGDLAMLVVLPDDPTNGLETFEHSLDAPKLAEIVGSLQRVHEVALSFPKFELNTRYELASTLAKMGMPTAFSSAADFSGIDGARDLQISDVVHQAFVKVDETGTEAAGATAVGMRALAMRHRTVFRADHPFLFLIRNVKTGAILFIGRVVHPGD